MEKRCRRAELNSKYLGGKRSLAKWEHICFSHSLAQWPHWSGGVLGWQAPARRRWWVNIQEFSNRFGYFRLAMIRVMTAGNWPLIYSWLLFSFPVVLVEQLTIPQIQKCLPFPSKLMTYYYQWSVCFKTIPFKESRDHPSVLCFCSESVSFANTRIQTSESQLALCSLINK